MVDEALAALEDVDAVLLVVEAEAAPASARMPGGAAGQHPAERRCWSRPRRPTSRSCWR